MMKKEEDQGQCSSQAINNNIQSYQEQLLFNQQILHQQQNYGQPWSTMPHNNNHDPFLVPPIVPSPYASFFNKRAPLPFPYEGPSSSSHHHEHLRIISDTIVGHSAPYGFQAELGKLSAQEIMEAKALAASKSHSEAERRRRERINNHLAKLRSLLPNTTKVVTDDTIIVATLVPAIGEEITPFNVVSTTSKTDKASLLAEVIQYVKELKRQTSLIAETSPVPTETDELMVDATDEEGKFVIKASLCCEDRSDLLHDLIKTLKALRLRTLKAEITTLGGRVKNVLFITGDDDNDTSSNSNSGDQNLQQYCISSIQEALKVVMAKSGSSDESTSGNVKRQRTNNINIPEQRSS